MPAFGNGRHEYGQNYLIDPAAIAAMVDAVRSTAGPIVEIGSGRGALTFRLDELNRPLTAIDIDERSVRWLQQRVPHRVSVIQADYLRWREPSSPHVLVGNLPFHQTTAMLRKMLRSTGWTDAVLLVQWEVARRRAGVGGSTMMTAQWSPWYEFSLITRVSARSFDPVPTVDGGIITLRRREAPLVEHRSRYQRFVHQVFTGRGHGIVEIVANIIGRQRRGQVHRWCDHREVGRRALPKDLTTAQMVDLYQKFGA